MASACRDQGGKLQQPFAAFALRGCDSYSRAQAELQPHFATFTVRGWPRQKSIPGLSSSRILRLSLGLVRGINTGGNNLLRRPSQLGGSRLGGSELTGLPFWLTCTNHRNRGRTSAARSTRATRMLTVPRSLNKSSTKDLT